MRPLAVRAAAASRRPTAEPGPAEVTVPTRWSREWIYFTIIFAAWCFTPLLRRLGDYRQGAYNPVQITSLIPFLLLLPLVWVCFKRERLARLTPFFRYLAYIWAAIFIYGFLVGAVFGVVSAAGFSLVEYLVPMLAGIWLAGQALPVTTALRRLAIIILPCAGIVALYGLLQWVQPPPWDVLWVQGSEFISVGDPVPFAMRIFSTLNSPGTAGDFFALTIVLALPFLRFRNLWAWPLVSAIGGALLLTLVREAWVGLVVGMIVYLVLNPRRLSLVPSLAVYIGLLIFFVTALPALMGSGVNSDVITSRISTFGDVDHDGSALDRKNQYGDAMDKGLSNPIGSGLGTVGAAAKLGAASQSSMIGDALDSGYFARFVELGWIGTLAYLVVVIGGPIALGFAVFRQGSTATVDVKVASATAVAICAVLAWGDAANDAHFSLDGFFFWIALGLGSLAIQSCSLAVNPAMRNRRQPISRNMESGLTIRVRDH
jgi:putative inorganic carbon (HCO3(-)) transporter